MLTVYQPDPGEEDWYAPEKIRFWLSGRCWLDQGCRWQMLESACEGATGSLSKGAGSGERSGLSHVKADLERAADGLPIYFQATRFVYVKQHREDVYKRRRQTERSLHPDERESESPKATEAYEQILERMARYLGWVPRAERKQKRVA